MTYEQLHGFLGAIAKDRAELIGVQSHAQAQASLATLGTAGANGEMRF